MGYLNAFACIPTALLLAHSAHWVKGFAAKRRLRELGSDLDMRYTRQGEAKAMDDSDLGLLVQRCSNCHNNGLEAFAYFSVAVIAATVCGVRKDVVDILALTFVLLRALYNYLYITGTQPWKGPARSLTWALGFGISIYLMIHAAVVYTPASL